MCLISSKIYKVKASRLQGQANQYIAPTIPCKLDIRWLGRFVAKLCFIF